MFQDPANDDSQDFELGERPAQAILVASSNCLAAHVCPVKVTE